jgi:LysR family hydrogen peroxide-inducible transcriptional activator
LSEHPSAETRRSCSALASLRQAQSSPELTASAGELDRSATLRPDDLLQSRAKQILTLIEDTKAEITDDGQTGRIRVAAIPTIAPYFLPQVLQNFGKSFPKATVIVQEDTTDNLSRALTDGTVDVAILALPIEAQYLEIEELFEEELLLLMAVDHPLTTKKQIRLTDIESLPFVLLGEAHCLSDNIVSFCRQKSFHPVSVERTSQLATVQELFSLNHGIRMVPAMAQRLNTSDHRVYRSLAGTRPQRKIAMVSNPYRFQSLLLKSFLEQLRTDQPERSRGWLSKYFLSAGKDFRRKANRVSNRLKIATGFINPVAQRSRPASKSSSARRTYRNRQLHPIELIIQY